MVLLKGTIKSALKLLLLVPLVLLVLWVNYFVDQTGLFRGDKFNLELAQILLEGDPVSNFEKMDEREVLIIDAYGNIFATIHYTCLVTSRLLHRAGISRSVRMAGDGDKTPAPGAVHLGRLG